MMKDMIMKVSRTITAGAFALASLGAVEAEGLRPVQSQTVDLGDLSGVAYYTVKRDGFHVVATLAQQGEDGAPLRVEIVLAPGQRVTFSTPRRVAKGLTRSKSADGTTECWCAGWRSSTECGSSGCCKLGMGTPARRPFFGETGLRCWNVSIRATR
jgi:hypothetical protein